MRQCARSASALKESRGRFAATHCFDVEPLWSPARLSLCRPVLTGHCLIANQAIGFRPISMPVSAGSGLLSLICPPSGSGAGSRWPDGSPPGLGHFREAPRVPRTGAERHSAAPVTVCSVARRTVRGSGPVRPVSVRSLAPLRCPQARFRCARPRRLRVPPPAPLYDRLDCPPDPGVDPLAQRDGREIGSRLRLLVRFSIAQSSGFFQLVKERRPSKCPLTWPPPANLSR
jgi:hypothetical protein